MAGSCTNGRRFRSWGLLEGRELSGAGRCRCARSTRSSTGAPSCRRNSNPTCGPIHTPGRSRNCRSTCTASIWQSKREESTMLETIVEQRKALETPVDPTVVKNNSNVKGPYTSGEDIRWKLNDIFGPDNWQHTIMDGPKLVDVNERNAYVQVTIRLITQFADGSQVTHDDVGVWPLVASKDKKLDEAAPERYETVIKAAVTDGVKACAEYLGICFRPMADDALAAYLRKRNAKPTGQASSQSPLPSNTSNPTIPVQQPAPAAA